MCGKHRAAPAIGRGPLYGGGFDLLGRQAVAIVAVLLCSMNSEICSSLMTILPRWFCPTGHPLSGEQSPTRTDSLDFMRFRVCSR